MGNCLIKQKSNINIKNKITENTQLLSKKEKQSHIDTHPENIISSNMDILKKISNKEICAICEKYDKNLQGIKNIKIKKLSGLVFCERCKIKLGF